MESLKPTPKLLLGPGPCNVSPRVLEAMSYPLMGHMDPSFLAIMDHVQTGLRTLFGTQNPFTLPISGAALVSANSQQLEAQAWRHAL